MKILIDGCLLGTERPSQIATTEEEERTTGELDEAGNEITYNTNNYIAGLFRSKPYWTRAIVDRHVGDVDGGSGTLSKSNPSPRQSSRPACAYDTRSIKSAEILDNFRWISDMYWINTEHRNGPNEFFNSSQYKLANLTGIIRIDTAPDAISAQRRSFSPDLLYLNTAGRIRQEENKGRVFFNHPAPGIDLDAADSGLVPQYKRQQGKYIGVVYVNEMFQVRTGGNPGHQGYEDVRTCVALRRIFPKYRPGPFNGPRPGWLDVTPVDQWKNIEHARSNFLKINVAKPAFFRETYSVYEIYGPGSSGGHHLNERNQLIDSSGAKISWNWYNYFYGHIRLDILERLFPEKTTELDRLGIFDPATRQQILKNIISNQLWVSDPEEYTDQNSGITRVKENNVYHWTKIYDFNPEVTKGYNLNPFPVIPYYGPNIENQNVSPDPFPSTSTGSDTTFRIEPPIVCNQPLIDYTTSIPELITKDEADLLDLENKTYFDIRPKYSYYDCILENIIHLGLHEIELPSPYRGDIDLILKSGVVREEGLSQPTRQDFDDLMLTRILRADNFFELNLLERYDLPQPGILFFNGRREQILEEIAEQINDPISGINIEKIRQFAHALDSLYNFDLMKDPYNQPSPGTEALHQEEKRDRQNLFLSIFSHEQLEDIYSKRHLNSSFVEIEIGNLEKSLLAESMVFDGDDNILVKDLFFALEDSLRLSNVDFPDIGFEDFTTSSEDPYGFGSGTYNDIIKRDTEFSYVEQLAISGFNDLNNRLLTKFEFSDNIPLSNKPFSFEDWWDKVWQKTIESDNETPPAIRFARIFKMLSVQANIRRFVEGNARTYEEILEGKPAVSEVMGYVIKKFEILENDRKRFISNIIIMSNDDHDVKKVVDSQVKYGKIYQYEIHRIVAVVGNEYVYLDNKTREQHLLQLELFEIYKSIPFNMQFGIINKPSLNLFLVPSERQRVCVVDRPPIHPDVDIIPFKNNQRNIMFNLSAQGGEYHDIPIILEEDDISQFTKAALMQGLASMEFLKTRFIGDYTLGTINIWEKVYKETGNVQIPLVHFRSDDPVKRFEVFRIEDYPSSYEDFKDKKIAVLKTGAENASFMDTIEPDKPYYYIFRTEDIHNQVSNPTNVFEVELRTYGEAVYPSIKIVEMKNKYTREDTKQLRQFIEIKPAIDKQRVDIPQSAMSDDLLDNKKNNELFKIKDNTLWNRKWKLRIISKNTGKEIDINFRFQAVPKGKENKKVNLIC